VATDPRKRPAAGTEPLEREWFAFLTHPAMQAAMLQLGVGLLQASAAAEQGVPLQAGIASAITDTVAALQRAQTPMLDPARQAALQTLAQDPRMQAAVARQREQEAFRRQAAIEQMRQRFDLQKLELQAANQLSADLRRLDLEQLRQKYGLAKQRAASELRMQESVFERLADRVLAGEDSEFASWAREWIAANVAQLMRDAAGMGAAPPSPDEIARFVQTQKEAARRIWEEFSRGRAP